ncbi:MFS general substrate transporter [Fimicolochytrium jonesii]|uniref:MFS general substrate transporter n=1 Tax=Fimicolochytrium jonesii TaxID=1396493 RepID=UPI0022FE9C68|nr:MFS general substrate transporter [Fimicolochytrium jonesii]KAI8819709.1 MFS general substrate transporter [Fimicolochytrium jonesii]
MVSHYSIETFPTPCDPSLLPTPQSGENHDLTSKSAEKSPSWEIEQTTHVTAVDEQPDGGLRGWLTVFGSWLFQFCMVGAVTSFGAYQDFYSERFLSNVAPSAISWIGTIQLFLEYFLGLSVGRLLDAGHFRKTVLFGTVVSVVSIFALSFCQQGQYYQVLLSQGLGMGAGLGIAFLPTSGVISYHFTKRKALAMGIATTGTSLGGFVFSVLLNRFFQMDGVGFAWGVRIIGFIVALGLAVANIVIDPNPRKPAKTSEISVDKNEKPSEPTSPPLPISALLRDPAYVLCISSGFIVCLGLYYPMFYIQTFARQHGISESLISYTLATINLSGILGRTMPNYLADRVGGGYGALKVYVPCTLAAGVLVFVMLACTQPASLVVFCILYGFFSGSIVSLYFPTVVSLDPNVTSTGVRLGLACMPVGLASLVGSPITATIVGDVDFQWARGEIFAGGCEIISAIFLFLCLRIKLRRERMREVMQ